MTAYYNEIDKGAAQWLRNLIEAGHIAPGIVDERSIEDVTPYDLKEFTQCHFFAGVGVWSHALRQAGWPDDRPVWTGSCPCQPFSAAGKGGGFNDERHLWPAFHHLIKECKPAVILGEQVASKDSAPWIDLVHTDLEALGYAVGAIPFPSAGIGAPHIRDRLYWVGNASGAGHQEQRRQRDEPTRPATADVVGGLADHNSDGCEPGSEGSEATRHGQATGADCGAGGLELLGGHRRERGQAPAPGNNHDRPAPERAQGQHGLGESGVHRIFEDEAGPTNGLWRDADWLFCRDGKWRPVEPGTFPLAHGAASQVVRLRAYGNAINAKAAQAFIECVMEAAHGIKETTK